MKCLTSVVLCVVLLGAQWGCSSTDETKGEPSGAIPASAIQQTNPPLPEQMSTSAVTVEANAKVTAEAPAEAAAEVKQPENEVSPVSPEARPAAEAQTAGGLPEQEIGEPELMDTGGLKLVSIVMARGVENTGKKRIPVDPGKRFTIDGNRVFAFLDVENPAEQAAELSVSWVPPEGARGGDEERGKISLSIPARPKYRTRAFNSKLKNPGLWHVVVRNDAGEVIGRAPFEMVEPTEN